MANYELGLTASEIDIALQKAHSPTTSITNSATSDPSLVTSGAVKSAIDNISVGSTLTVDSFATAALETSTDTLTDTDTAIPTSAAVKDFIANNVKPEAHIKFNVLDNYTLNDRVFYDIPVTRVASNFGAYVSSNRVRNIPNGTYMYHFDPASFGISGNSSRDRLVLQNQKVLAPSANWNTGLPYAPNNDTISITGGYLQLQFWRYSGGYSTPGGYWLDLYKI